MLYVDPDWWGSDAGQLLIEQAHLELGESCDEAVLTVLAANPRARRFYERNGWALDALVTEPHFVATAQKSRVTGRRCPAIDSPAQGSFRNTGPAEVRFAEA